MIPRFHIDAASRQGREIPAMNRWTSPTATDRSFIAASRSDLLSSTTLVRVAEPVLELDDLGVAVAQRRDEGRQILDDVDDVAAAVGQDAPDPRETWPSVWRSLSPLPASASAGMGTSRSTFSVILAWCPAAGST